MFAVRGVAVSFSIFFIFYSVLNLAVGLVWWGFGILLAIGYFVFVYRMFRGKVVETADVPGH